MQEVLKGMRNKPLKLTESQKAEIEFATGQKWNKAIFGKFKYSENGVPLDSWWQDMAANYPGVNISVSVTPFNGHVQNI